MADFQAWTLNGWNEQLVIPFINLLNDAYCRDISIKTCTSLEMKQQKGEYVGAFAPYGYRLHEKVNQEETVAASQEKNMESAHLEKEVFGGDSKLTYEIVDYYVEKMIVNGTEDINIEWREGRRQQA